MVSLTNPHTLEQHYADTIAAFWRRRGGIVKVRLESFEQVGICVRSDLLNGMPRKWTLKVVK